MPTYEFRNNNTGKIEEYLLSFSKVDKFKEDNPHLERVWTDTPSVIYKVVFILPTINKHQRLRLVIKKRLIKVMINLLKKNLPRKIIVKNNLIESSNTKSVKGFS
jgi:hypothetical protein